MAEATLMDKPPTTDVKPAATEAAGGKPASAVKAPVSSPGEGDGAAPEPTKAELSDWRKAIIDARAAGDEQAAAKITKKLERFSDPGALFDAAEEATRKITELTGKGHIRIPGKDATAEDVAGFAKALGVPDKPDGYKLDLKTIAPEGYEPDEGDREILDAIKAHMHGVGGMAAAPETVQAAARLYFSLKEQAAAQAEATSMQAVKQTEADLKKTWGQDFTTNMAMANAGATGVFGRQWAELKELRLADGTKLGNWRPLIEAMATAGRALSSDPLFMQANSMADDGATLEARKAEIMKWRDGSAEERRRYAQASQPGGELAALNRKLAAVKAA